MLSKRLSSASSRVNSNRDVRKPMCKDTWLQIHGHDVATAIDALHLQQWSMAAHLFTDLIASLGEKLRDSALAGELWSHLSEALLGEGNTTQALEAVKRSLALLPADFEHLPALTTLARSLAASPNTRTEAIAIVARLIKIDPPYLPAFLLAAELAMERGDSKLALSHLRTIASHAAHDERIATRAMALESKLLLWQNKLSEAAPLLHHLASLPSTATIPRVQVEASVLYAGLRLLSGHYEVGASYLAEALLRASSASAGEYTRGSDKVCVYVWRMNNVIWRFIGAYYWWSFSVGSIFVKLCFARPSPCPRLHRSRLACQRRWSTQRLGVVSSLHAPSASLRRSPPGLVSVAHAQCDSRVV